MFIGHSKLTLGPTACLETSVTNYQSMLHNIPEQQRPKICLLSTKLSVMSSSMTAYGQMPRRMSTSVLLHMQKKELATAGISSLDILRDNHAADRSSRGDEEGDEHGLELVMSFTDAHIAYETVTTLF